MSGGGDYPSLNIFKGLKMVELWKNIGLGLFVNSSFGIMHGDFSASNIYIITGSIALMWFCIKRQKGLR